MSCCHGSKISGWQQNENVAEKWICIISYFIDLIQFHLVCQMLTKLSGVDSERTISVMKKYPMKRACEIKKFHVALLQGRLRSEQKKYDHMQSCCFAKINQLFSFPSCCRCRPHYFSFLLLWSENFDVTIFLSIFLLFCYGSLQGSSS